MKWYFIDCFSCFLHICIASELFVKWLWEIVHNGHPDSRMFEAQFLFTPYLEIVLACKKVTCNGQQEGLNASKLKVI
jgi:hypothetical protein